MLTPAQVQSIQKLLGQPGPVLSLYLSTNPAQGENTGRAYLTRAKEGMKALDVPKEVFDALMSRLEEDRPQARTRVMFADGQTTQVYDFQVELPLEDGIESCWGQPYLTPLLYAFDEYERHAVVLIDQEKWRLFEVFMGEIEELEDASRTLPVNEFRRLGEDKVAGAGGRSAGAGAIGHVGRASGGSGKDNFNERVGEWTERFYKEQAQRLSEVMKTRGIEQVILMGPDPDSKNFAGHLNAGLEPYIFPSANHSRVSAGEILKIVEKELPPLERERENKLLDQLREKGVSGVDQVVKLLQEGRIHLLVAPWKLEAKVYRCASGLVLMASEEAQTLCPQDGVKEASLKEVLPELAQAYAAKLEFVHGEAEQRLLQVFGGLAGLTRW